MLRLLVLLMSMLVRADDQLIYPDQFESILRLQSSRPTETAYSTDSFGNRRLENQPFVPASAAASPSDDAQNRHREPSDLEAEYWDNHVNDILARGVGKFAIDMDRAIYRFLEKPETGLKPNVVFSPLSIVGTLAMVLLGSAGVTFDQVSQILGLESGVDISSHSEIVHLMLGHVLRSIISDPSANGPKITMANAMFVQNGYPIRNEFAVISKQAYNNEVVNVDFYGEPNLTKETINDWVEARTMGKINSILDGPLYRGTKLVIASALYFKGEWLKYFMPKVTSRKPFNVTPERSIMVDMMFNGGDFPFYEDRGLGVKILGLPYRGSRNETANGPGSKPEATMYVLLPTARDADALGRLEQRLNIKILEALIDRTKMEKCTIAIPRMKLSSSLKLHKALSSLGLRSLFDETAANLALLSPGVNSTTSQPEGIFTRMAGGEDDDPVTANEAVTRPNSFSYTDRKGGYFVKQWRSGVDIRKISKSDHRRRSISDDETGKSGRVRAEAKNVRSKRQSRPMDEEFVRFVQSRKAYPNYGLDSLRNSPNLANPRLFASDVLHKVEMDITETGTEAAAATAVVLVRGGNIKIFNANRPFLFFIRHESTRMIMFWGTVNTPTPNY